MERSPVALATLVLLASACTQEGPPTSFVTDGWGEEEDSSEGDPSASSETSGESNSAGDGDGDSAGDGDGDSAGDGDGDSAGDGDGDSAGDGDGDAPGDGDGDGDAPGDGDGDVEPEDCGAPADHISCDAWGEEVSPLQALGLDCPGDASNSTATTANTFEITADESWRIATQFGSSGDWVASEGESVLVISTGVLQDTDEQGLLLTDGFEQDNENPDNWPLPQPMSPFQGSDNGAGGTPFVGCDLVNDCSDSLLDQWILGGGVANDLLDFEFSVEVPPGTYGWELDFAYFSNEFPEYVGSQYNDIFVVWEVSESYVGNICFIDGQPCTVTALDAIADGFSGPEEAAHPSLAGTGSDGMSHPSLGGQTTGWVSLEGPASPDEELSLHFALLDMGDELWDTTVVLDHWRWNCQGCVPNEVDDCGVQPS